MRDLLSPGVFLAPPVKEKNDNKIIYMQHNVLRQ